MASTGRAPLPASAEAYQSRNRSSVRRSTGAGMVSNCRPAAKAASVALGFVSRVMVLVSRSDGFIRTQPGDVSRAVAEFGQDGFGVLPQGGHRPHGRRLAAIEVVRRVQRGQRATGRVDLG